MDTPKYKSNLYLEEVDAIIQPPNKEDVGKLRDPEDYMIKMNDIASPNERLKILVKSVLTPWDEPTLEGTFIRYSAFVGGAVGFFYGGFLMNRYAHEDYIRKHNASVFEGRYRGNRHFWDSLGSQVLGRGLKYGFRVACLTLPATCLAFGSITYRNDLYQPDWLVGFSVLGGLSRLWIGARGVAAGSLMGLCAGFAGYGMARAIEGMSGYSVPQIRYLNHVEWANNRASERRLKMTSQFNLQKKFLDESEDVPTE